MEATACSSACGWGVLIILFVLFKATKELGEKRKVCLMVTSATPATSAISRWDFLSALAWEYSVNDVFSIDIIIKELCRHLEDINVLVR